MPKEIDIEKFAKIVKEQRILLESLKKGVWKVSEHEAPEGISTRDYERRQLEILNELEKLANEPLSKFTKDENGRWILSNKKSKA